MKKALNAYYKGDLELVRAELKIVGIAKSKKSEIIEVLIEHFQKAKQMLSWKVILDNSLQKAKDKLSRALSHKEDETQSLVDVSVSDDRGPEKLSNIPVEPETFSQPTSEQNIFKTPIISQGEKSHPEMMYHKLIEGMSSEYHKLSSELIDGLESTTEHKVREETQGDFHNYHERGKNAERRLE